MGSESQCRCEGSTGAAPFGRDACRSGPAPRSDPPCAACPASRGNNDQRGIAWRDGTTVRSLPPRPRFAQPSEGGVAWHLREQALTGECRGRWSTHRLLAVNANERTLPRLRAALNSLPAVFAVDAFGAWSIARSRLLASCTKASKRAGAWKPPRIPWTPAHGIARPPSPCSCAGQGRAVRVPARPETPSVRPCRRPDPSSTYVEQSPPNVLGGKDFPAELNITPNST